MRQPTEKQAALAARQLHYHRERLGWIRDRMRKNEATFSLYLTGLEARAAILPGGYRISGERASADRDRGKEAGPRGPLRAVVAPHRRPRDRPRGSFRDIARRRRASESRRGRRAGLRGEGVHPLLRRDHPRRRTDGGEDRPLPRLRGDRKGPLLPVPEAEGPPRTVAAGGDRRGGAA